MDVPVASKILATFVRLVTAHRAFSIENVSKKVRPDEEGNATYEENH